MAGRDQYGIVPPEAAAGLAKKIAARLLKVKDGKEKPVRATYLGDEIFRGTERRDAPDIRVALADGYRASWSTTLGGIPDVLFQDNLKKWSGDHASADPADVPGILVSNVPVRANPRIEDLAATALWGTQQANIGVAQLVDSKTMKLSVWERPGFLTQACGTGACVAVAAAHRRGLTTESRMTVTLPGGSMEIELKPDNTVVMIGPIEICYVGYLSGHIR